MHLVCCHPSLSEVKSSRSSTGSTRNSRSSGPPSCGTATASAVALRHGIQPTIQTPPVASNVVDVVARVWAMQLPPLVLPAAEDLSIKANLLQRITAPLRLCVADLDEFRDSLELRHGLRGLSQTDARRSDSSRKEYVLVISSNSQSY